MEFEEIDVEAVFDITWVVGNHSYLITPLDLALGPFDSKYHIVYFEKSSNHRKVLVQFKNIGTDELLMVNDNNIKDFEGLPLLRDRPGYVDRDIRMSVLDIGVWEF